MYTVLRGFSSHVPRSGPMLPSVRVGKDTAMFGRVSVRLGSDETRGTVIGPPSR